MRVALLLVLLPVCVLAHDAQVAPIAPSIRPEPVAVGAPPAAAPAADDWSAYGRSNEATRYAPHGDIRPENVAELKESWRVSLGAILPALAERWAPRTTPLKIGADLFLCTATGEVLALDAANGTERWRYQAATPGALTGEASCRGVAFHESLGADAHGLCRQRILGSMPDGSLWALDASSGEPCREFGQRGRVRLAASAPPTVVRGVAVVASEGAVIGLSAVSGRELWRWPEVGQETKQKTVQEAVQAQAVFSADEELGLVYVPLRQPAQLVALDVTRGEAAWAFTAVHEDVWGYGLVAQATLLDWPAAEGSTVPALVLPTVHGELFVLDREHGEPLVAVTSQPIPAGYGPAGALPVAQPRSALPGPRPPPLKEEDAWSSSLVGQLWCRIQFRRLVYQGRFTPPAERPWLQPVGELGGIGWGGVSVDAGRGLLVFNYNRLPMRGTLRDGTPSREPWPCMRPPHGGLMAIDIEHGTLAWERLLGHGGLSLPFGWRLPWPVERGTVNQGGVLLTEGGLAFVAATTDNYFRAFDVATGEERWRARLPAGGQATPISYRIDGRQYVAIVAGGDYQLDTDPGHYLLVFALPD